MNPGRADEGRQFSVDSEIVDEEQEAVPRQTGIEELGAQVLETAVPEIGCRVGASARERTDAAPEQTR